MTSISELKGAACNEDGLCLVDIKGLESLGISKKNMNLAILLCKEGSLVELRHCLLMAKSERMGLEACRRQIHRSRKQIIPVYELTEIYKSNNESKLKETLEVMFLSPMSWTLYTRVVKTMCGKVENIETMYKMHSLDVCRPLVNILIEVDNMQSNYK